MPVLADLLFQLADGAFAVDARRRVIFWNPACEELLGVPAREALGRPCHEVVHLCDGSGKRYCGPDCRLAQLARGGAAPKVEPRWVEQDVGKPRKLWLSVFLMPSQSQDLWTVVHLLQREAPAGLPLDQEQPAAGGRRGGTRNTEDRSDAGFPQAPALTTREREILRLLAQGHLAGAISRRLCISAVTVRNHIQHLIGKLGLHSQIEAVAFAYRNNLVAAAPQREMAPRLSGECVR